MTARSAPPFGLTCGQSVSLRSAVRFDFQRNGRSGWIRTSILRLMNARATAHRPRRATRMHGRESNRRTELLCYGAEIRQPGLRRPLPVTDGVRRCLRFGGVNELVGHLGAAPSVSPPRTARIAVFLVPGRKSANSQWWSHRESHPDLRNAIVPSCY